MNPEQDPTTPEPVTDADRPRPRIYVASLSDYNAGRLHGRWIDADQDVDEIQADVDAMLANSPEPVAEEWAIHDYEGFGPLALSEYETFDHVARLGDGIATHGPVFAAWANQIDTADWDRLDDFDEQYRGQWASTEEYAEELLESLGYKIDELGPAELAPYIRFDLAAWAAATATDLIVIADDTDSTVHILERPQ